MLEGPLHWRVVRPAPDLGSMRLELKWEDREWNFRSRLISFVSILIFMHVYSRAKVRFLGAEPSQANSTEADVDQ